jgi:hypothetical protein
MCTVYEAKGVGMVMGLYLLNGLSHQINHTIAISSDSQTLIKALDNQ